MDRIAMLERAVDAASTMIRSVGADELKKPTPCTEWDVKAVMNHMAGTCTFFTTVLAGNRAELPPQVPPDLLGSNPAGSYDSISQAMLDAWRAPGALERTLAMPSGDAPAALGINIIFADQLLHTWDLARALGRPFTMDADLAEASLEILHQILRPESRGPGRGFAEAVPCSDHAPVQERLVAFSGRQP